MSKAPSTPATRLLREKGIPYTEHLYRYEEKGGTRVSARELGVDEHAVVKTLVMEDETKAPLIILMHGDREVSTKNLARQADRKTVAPCAPDVAQKHTGYLVGGTGRSFDWGLLPRLAGPVVLAGGLTPENVRAAVRQVRPWAVDVASGVEDAPGVKNAQKMQAFISEAQSEY